MDITKAIQDAGVPNESKILISRPSNGLKASAEINDLDNSVCLNAISYLNGKVLFGNKIYCKGSSNLFTPTRDITDTAGKNGSPSSKISLTPDASSIPGLVLSKRQLKKLNKKKANLQETVNTVNISDYEFDNLDSSVLSGKNIAKDGVDDIQDKKRNRTSPLDELRRMRPKSAN